MRATTHTTNDLLVVVMVVWDAKEDVCKALDPYVQAGVSSFLIYNVDYEWDADDTLQRVQEFFDRHHIANYHLMQESFGSNADVINHALDTAEAQFPHVTFLLKHDRADRYLQNISHLLQFCNDERQSKQPCYLMQEVLADYNAGKQHKYWRSGLIRAHTKTRYQGNEYEYIALDVPWQRVPKDIFFTEHAPFEEGLQAHREYWKQKDLARMRAVYEDNSKNK